MKKVIFCPLPEKKLKQVFRQLDESQADKVLVYFTHLPLHPFCSTLSAFWFGYNTKL